MKLSCKVKDNYGGLNEIPGVLVDQVKRTKILKDCGIQEQKISYKSLYGEQENQTKKLNKEISQKTENTLNKIQMSEQTKNVPEDARLKNSSDVSSLEGVLKIQ